MFALLSTVTGRPRPRRSFRQRSGPLPTRVAGVRFLTAPGLSRLTEGRLRPKGLLAWHRPRPVSEAVATWRPSHRALLTCVDPPRVAEVRARAMGPDLVVVPTAYTHETPRPGLTVAAECALASGAPLVVLCSKGAATRKSVEALDKKLRDLGVVQAHVVQVEPDASGLTSFAVDRLPISTAWRRGGAQPGEQRLAVVNDVGQKRNLGLAVARSMGAASVMFVDDDIAVEIERDGEIKRHERTLTPASLAAATQAVTSGQCAAVGWPARDFDDNSVLMRIRKDMGAPQGQFIGAGALLVDAHDERLPFFPAIFNEDWMFLLGYLLDNPRRRAFGEAGDVHQQHRPPYSARRAASEEMGDLLGEALLTQVRPDGVDLSPCERPDFWREAFENRRGLRDQLQATVDGCSHDRKTEMLEALEAIRNIHRAVRDQGYVHLRQLAEYVSTWRSDLDRWHEDLTQAPRRDRAVALQTRTLRSWGSQLDLLGPA